MTQRNTAVAALILVLFTTASTTAQARAIRVDSGDWDNSGFLNAGSTQALGFDFQMLGVSGSQATISTDGSVQLSGGTGTANLNPFFDTAQLGSGNTVQYQFGTTNSGFAGNTPGVEAGFRVEWLVLDSSGALLNEFQLAMFELSGGIFALEFNYNQLTFAGNDPMIGFFTSLGENFDLAAELMLDFAGYSGVGDDGFGNNGCPANPSALACRNYYDGNFGTDGSILPGIANGFFRNIDSNGDPVQGRYLWLFDGNVAPVAAPATLWLFSLGALLLGLRRRATAPYAP